MDILLILGSVTQEQYSPLRLAMIRKGLKPVVRRIATSSDELEFFFSARDEWEKDNDFITQSNESDWKPWIRSREEELKTELLNSAIRGASFGDVKAILFQKDAVIDKDWNWITNKIDDDTPCYRVEQSESDGSQFLIGRGFGEVLDIKK